MLVRLEKNLMLKEAKIGFSWTTFFFGFFVPAFRGDVKWSILMLLLAIFTCNISGFILPFIYNKIYIKSLLENGWEPSTEIDRHELVRAGMMISKLKEKVKKNI